MAKFPSYRIGNSFTGGWDGWQPKEYKAGNPGVWGTAGATLTKPKVAKKATTYDPYKQATAGVEAIIASLLASVQSQQDAARKQAETEAAQELEKGRALAFGLQKLGIAPAVQNIFQSAGQNQAGLAQGFSGQIRDQASAQAADQIRQLSGTGQEGAVRNEGTAMGNVTYGTGGFIPGTELNTLGAAYGAQAALQPGFAQQFGNIASATRTRDYTENELPKFLQERLDVLAKKPGLFQELLADERAWAEKLFESKGKATTKPYNLQTEPVGNGQLQWFDPRTGRAVGKPFGSTDAPSGRDYNLKAVPTANGQIQWYDPRTGQPVGAPVGPPKAAEGYNLKAVPLPNGQMQWYDPRTGKKVGKPFGAPKASESAPRLDEGGRLTGRTDGITATQARDYKQTAYLSVKQWHAQGGKVDVDGEDGPGGQIELSPIDVLKLLVDGGPNRDAIPYDLAVRQLARFSPAARKWLKQGVNPITGKSTRSTRLASVTSVRPEKGAIVSPASFTSTHMTDNLGWPAVDIMAKKDTPIASPVSGTIIRHGSAQGGEAMYLQADDGTMYWLGHIYKMLPVGTTVKQGQTIARVSPDHPAPHLHLAKQSGDRA